MTTSTTLRYHRAVIGLIDEIVRRPALEPQDTELDDDEEEDQ